MARGLLTMHAGNDVLPRIWRSVANLMAYHVDWVLLNRMVVIASDDLFIVTVIALTFALARKWLGVHPASWMAAFHDVATHAGVPVRFAITIISVTNLFFAPQLGSQIRAAAAPQSVLSLVARQTGTLEGKSANDKSGHFDAMKFQVIATSSHTLGDWLAELRQTSQHLNVPTSQAMAGRDEKYPGRHYWYVESTAYSAIGDHLADMSALMHARGTGTSDRKAD
jgi:heme/copper-type cytochrome/quinol oxidase subunit 2